MYQRDDQGRIRVPVSLDTPNGGIADGGMWVSPGDHDYPKWNEWLSRFDAEHAQDDMGKAAGPDPKAQPPTGPGTGAPTQPQESNWPAWAMDLALATVLAAVLTAALTRGVDTRAVAAEAAAKWPTTAPTLEQLTEWLTSRLGDDITSSLRPVLEDGLTEAYALGVLSSDGVLEAEGEGTDIRAPGVIITADWRGWTPGNVAAARKILSEDGMTVGLRDLLDEAGVTLKGIVGQRLDEIAAVLADGLELGKSPAEMARALSALGDRTWAMTVAWTETNRATSAAAMDNYLAHGVEYGEWFDSMDARVCPICRGNAAAGPVPIGDRFPSGDKHPPGHPRCRCALLPAYPVEALAGKSARAVATGNEGNAERLHTWWTRGKGRAKWIATAHPWATLRRHLARFIHDPDELDRTTSQWFHDGTGIWSGERKGRNPVGPG